MIVRRSIFEEVVKELSVAGTRAVDTETTGLRIWQDDRLFSIIISDGKKEWYFNFQKYPGLADDWILPRTHIRKLKPIFANPDSFWYLHNAKFDMGVLWREGLELAGEVHCCMAIGRVQKNNRFNYSLDALLKDLGQSKLDTVKEYIKKHKLYRLGPVDEDGEQEKIPCYDKVPFEIIVPYGEMDARGTFNLGEHQVAKIAERQAQIPAGKPGPQGILLNERRLTKTFFNMERAGIRVDQDFSRRALAHEKARMVKAATAFQVATGVPFVDSAKTLAPAFDRVGERYPLTDKGNPSFKRDVLEEFTSPIARLVLDYRNAQKRANTYFANFLYYSDSNGYIHPNAKQGGTEPGRVSYSDPNFQNLPKRREKRTDEFNVRRAVIPSPGNFLAMLDYDQMEYRLMLEYAREMDVIAQVLGGLDVHEATASMLSDALVAAAARMGIAPREIAKTLNFLFLYGGGVAKLCAGLFKPRLQVDVLKALVRKYLWKRPSQKPAEAANDIRLLSGLNPDDVAHDVEELKKALEIQELYFAKLPRVKDFTRKVTEKAKNEGYVKNWAGRICHFAYSEYAYSAPNHLIQGGCADVVKIAMNEIDAFMKGRKSKMILQVHDELLLDMHPSEAQLLHEIKAIMERAYPYRYLPLTVGVDHSWKSWADKEEGIPA
jgi:DNA polymerase-1